MVKDLVITVTFSTLIYVEAGLSSRSSLYGRKSGNGLGVHRIVRGLERIWRVSGEAPRIFGSVCAAQVGWKRGYV